MVYYASVIRLLGPFVLALAVVLSGCQGNRGPTRAETALADSMNAKAEAANRRARIAFDPARETIVAELARNLMRDYRLAVAYRDRSDEPPRRRYAAYRYVHYPKCFGPSEASVNAYQLSSLGKDRNTCILTTYEPPPADAVVARKVYRRLTIDGVATNEHRLVIRRPDGATAEVVYYSARDELKSQRIGTDALAAALGLQRRSNTDPEPPGQQAVEDWIAASQRRMQAAYDELVGVLAATGRLPEGSSFSASHVDPETIARNADPLINQLSRGLVDQGAMIDTASISRALALLPEDAWQRESQSILAVLDRSPPIDADWNGELLMRLADLGPAAIPTLSRAKGTRDLPEAVVVAACRIGPAARPAFENRLLEDWRRANLPRRKSAGSRSSLLYKKCVADGERHGPPDDVTFSSCWRPSDIWGHSDRVYFALKRLGLGRKADAMARHTKSRQYARDFADIGPSSPAKVCYENPRR